MGAKSAHCVKPPCVSANMDETKVPMKKTITINIIWTLLLLSTSCQPQDKIPNFGKYYKIGEYNVQVPFANQPNISPIQENEICKLTSYQYSFPKPEDDINDLYGIEICQLKNSNMFPDTLSKIDFLVNNRRTMYQNVHGGTFIKQDKENFRGQYAIRQKIKVNVPNVGEDYITSLYFLHDNLLIRLFVITPINEADNEKIDNYFETIKFN